MENKINIAELLKDCPKGMEMDCMMFENVFFDCVTDNPIYPIRLYVQSEKDSITLTSFGCTTPSPYAKCVIFPKGKTTWEGFQKPFKDGDILTYTNNHTTTFIYRKKDNEPNFSTSFYVACNNAPFNNFLIYNKYALIALNGNCDVRLATEEEKEKLFKAIKANGYKWNEETKTLEKLPKFKVGDRVQNKNTNMIGTINLIINDEREYRVSLKNGGITYILFEFQDNWELVKDNSKPKFKVGDRITKRDSIVNSWIVLSVSSEYYGLKLPNGHEGIGVLSIAEQDDYELVKDNINPKFKVGDRIRKEDNNSMVYTINGVYSSMYGVEERDFGISIEEQDEYELVPNKFDITTLKAFESKVLVRDINTHNWIGSFYSHYEPNGKKFYIIGGSYYLQCIPYKGNEHLLDTSNDCDEYYKTW